MGSHLNYYNFNQVLFGNSVLAWSGLWSVLVLEAHGGRLSKLVNKRGEERFFNTDLVIIPRSMLRD